MQLLLENSEKKILKPEKKTVQQFKKIIGFKPRHTELYHLAVIHKSAASKVYHNPKLNNERLEFLGDAILDSIVAEHLYYKYPDRDEGFLTQLRSKIVNRETLKRISIKLGLANMVEAKVANDNHKSVYGDALEAIIGAIYLDKGYKKTKKFILERIIDHHINLKKLAETEIDFKSRIIEWGQKNKKDINFTCQEESNKDNRNPQFISHLLIADKIIGMGSGTSKKEAEQNAARQALNDLDTTSN
ncbi:MAG: ribonuclease III [Bacteroidales bacterium]|nr:ribonuclease III [Bacteroidales bacterium]MBN2821450.1 ribonuclease III [Bacteroidales bacterium]